MMGHTRRRFFQATVGSSLVIGVDSLAPECLRAAASESKATSEHVLVVVQLSGGNDGLNTVIPFADADYHKARPSLGFRKDGCIPITDDLGLHTAMRELSKLQEGRRLSIVQGVGYENPNRSHFESMDIWHTCLRKDKKRESGWLGKYVDRFTSSVDGKEAGDVPALHLGRGKQPLALVGKENQIPSVASLDEFRLQSRGAKDFEKLIQQLATQSNPSTAKSPMADASSDLLDFVRSSTNTALVASERVNEAQQTYKTDSTYPDTRLAKKLSVVAQLIDADLPAKVYYVELDGFDTHSQQAGAHAALLKEWSEAVSTFLSDVESHGHGDRVCVMTFSEFGRRVSENASAGTDHGAAAPMFFAGGGLSDLLIGEHPSLTDLHDGDLKYSVDFRRVYASVLEQWLGMNSEAILSGSYEPLPIFT